MVPVKPNRQPDANWCSASVSFEDAFFTRCTSSTNTQLQGRLSRRSISLRAMSKLVTTKYIPASARSLIVLFAHTHRHPTVRSWSHELLAPVLCDYRHTNQFRNTPTRFDWIKTASEWTIIWSHSDKFSFPIRHNCARGNDETRRPLRVRGR